MPGAKRKLCANAGEAVDGISSKKVKAMIQCPVCFDLPRAEVYQCVNGHSVCGKCIEELVSCPVCRTSYLQGKIRNLTTEEILSNVLFRCSWEEQGCRQDGLNRQQLTHHEVQCQYNPNPVQLCRLLFLHCNCSYQVSRAIFRNLRLNFPPDLRDHMRQAHGVKLKQVLCGTSTTQAFPQAFLTKVVSNASQQIYSGGIFELLDNHESLGWYMALCYNDTCTSEMSWLVVRITDDLESGTLGMRYTLKSSFVDADGVPEAEMSWNGQLMSLYEFNEFKNKPVREREKLKYSIALVQIRKHYLNAEGGFDLGYKFTFTRKTKVGLETANSDKVIKLSN